MTTTYQERPRKGGGTECCLNFNGDHDHTVARSKENNWRRLLPIAFTAENAQKVHDGTKNQTRRLLNPQPTYQGFDGPPRYSSAFGDFRYPGQVGFTPRYRVGDVLWVQEPWRTWKSLDCTKPTELPATREGYNQIQILYEADRPLGGWPFSAGKLRPAMFLQLRFARPARYEVTAVRCERVSDISEKDAIAEGCPKGVVYGVSRETPLLWFENLWNSIYDKPGTRFDDAPWVFAYTFRRVR